MVILEANNEYSSEYISLNGRILDSTITFENSDYSIALIEVLDLVGDVRYGMVTVEFSACVSREVDAVELSEEAYTELLSKWERCV